MKVARHVSQLSSYGITEVGLLFLHTFLFFQLSLAYTCHQHRIRTTIQNSNLPVMKTLQCPLRKWLHLFQLLPIPRQPCRTTLNTRLPHRFISPLAQAHHQRYQHQQVRKQFSLLHHGPILQRHPLCEHHQVVEVVKRSGIV